MPRILPKSSFLHQEGEGEGEGGRGIREGEEPRARQAGCFPCFLPAGHAMPGVLLRRQVGAAESSQFHCSQFVACPVLFSSPCSSSPSPTTTHCRCHADSGVETEKRSVAYVSCHRHGCMQVWQGKSLSPIFSCFLLVWEAHRYPPDECIGSGGEVCLHPKAQVGRTWEDRWYFCTYAGMPCKVNMN